MEEEGDNSSDRWMGTFSMLPMELLLHFMSYLNIREIFYVFPSLNKQWQALMSEEEQVLVPLLTTLDRSQSNLWRDMFRHFSTRSTTEGTPAKINLKAIFHTIDNWKKGSSRCTQLRLHSSVQAVHIDDQNGFLFAGTQGSTINRYRMEDINKNPNKYVQGNKHIGWVRGIDTLQNTLFTCSDDKTVQAWINEENAITPVQALKAHSGIVRCIHVNPDTVQLVSGSNDSNINLVDISTMTLLRTFSGHRTMIRGCRFSSTDNGRTIYSGSEDGTLRYWDVLSGKCIATYECGARGGIWSLRESNGVIAVGTESKLQLWSARTGKLQWYLSSGQRTVFSLAMNYNRLALGTQGGIFVWPNISKFEGLQGAVSVDEKEPEYRYDRNKSVSNITDYHRGIVLTLHMSPTHMVTGGDDETLLLWDYSPPSIQ